MKSKELKDKIDSLRKEYKTAILGEFKDASGALFEQYPDLKSFGFTCFTPYFNDGDECSYRANISYPKINGDEENIYNTDPKIKGVVDFLKQFDDQDYEDMFGDGYEITITAKGIKKTEYDHD